MHLILCLFLHLVFGEEHPTNVGRLPRIGISAGIMICVAFNYMAEILPSASKANSTTLINIAPSIIGIFYTLSLKFVTKWSYELQTIGLFSTIIGTLGMFFIVESPKFLYSRKRFQACEGVINQIAKINGITEHISVSKVKLQVKNQIFT